MPFSDEDLAKLKESMEHYPAWYQERCSDILPRILTRLEAAEAFAGIMEGGVEFNECDSCLGDEDDDGKRLHEKDCEVAISLEAWRKAAGK